MVVNPPIDQALAAHIAAQAFGEETKLLALIPLHGGQINSTAMLVTGEGRRSVLRIAPDRATAAQGPTWLTARGLRREAAAIAAMPDLAHLLPVTVAHSFGDNEMGRDWVVQEVIPGVPLSTIDEALEPDTRATIWQEVGSFTRQMHDHSSSRFGPPGESGFESWTGLLASDAAGLLGDAQRFDMPTAPFEHLAQLISDYAPTLDRVSPPCLIHSDLLPPHIFVTDDDDGDLHLSGVIDLEFARYADRASEHVLPEFGLGHVPDPMHEAFHAGYGITDPIVERPGHAFRRAIYLAVGIGWNLGLVAFQQGETADLIGDFETALANAEALAIG